MKFFDRYQSWLHVLGWLVFISLPFLTLPDFIWNRQDLISIGIAQLLTSALIIGFFYVNLLSLTPTLLREKNTRQFLGIVAGMLVSVVLLRVSLYYVFPPASMLQPRPGLPGMAIPPPDPGIRPLGKPGFGGAPHSPWPSALGIAFSLGFALMVSSLMALFRHHTRSQETQQQMVLEKVSAELAMLKLQVSPHFLFNTLNNIRWLARKKSDQTEAAVVTLAQLLRYMIYQAQQDRVPLRQEVQHLQDYIDLQTMRLTSNHVVTFSCEGDIDAYQIEPLLFIPFVENAFKYGVFRPTGSEPSDRGPINIWLKVVEHTLTFGTENPTRGSADSLSAQVANPDLGQPIDAASESGIGIANVQKRLTLHYPGQHELALSNENNVFQVVLNLHLHHDQVALHRH